MCYVLAAKDNFRLVMVSWIMMVSYLCVILDLRQQLAENEREMEAMHQTWDQRLEEAQREWEESTPRRAKSSFLQHPYLQNINEDPQLSGIVKFCLEPGEG